MYKLDLMDQKVPKFKLTLVQKLIQKVSVAFLSKFLLYAQFAVCKVDTQIVIMNEIVLMKLICLIQYNLFFPIIFFILG